MATASTPIAIPGDVHAFAANVSPRGVDLEGRLDLSLDALIKERKKEQKQLKKQEGAKKLQQKPQADKRKTPKQQKPPQKQQQATVKGGQKAQRKALVNKNRGLPSLPAAAKDKKAQNKTKTSIATTTAKLRRQMRADKANNRQVVSPKAVKGTRNNNKAVQQPKKKHAPQQSRKVVQPTHGKKQQVVKQQPKTQTKAAGRQVMRANNKKTKLNFTIAGQASKKSQKKQRNADKVVLPGKLSQTLGKKTSAAKKVVKRAKNRKATSAKTTKVVRQVPGQRKKN